MSGSWSLGKYRTLDELYFDAIFERAGDNVATIRLNAQSAILTTGVQADVWQEGGIKVYPTVAAQMSIVSASIEDKEGGDGIYQITVEGVDGDYNPIGELVTLNGTTPVLTTLSYLRCNAGRASFTGAGSNRLNVGKITLTIGGDVQATMEANKAFIEHSHYTVPLGYTMLLPRFSLNIYPSSGGGRREALFEGVASRPDGGIATTFFGIASDGSGFVQEQTVRPLILPEKTDTKFMVTSPDANTLVSVSIDIFIVKQAFSGNNPFL